MIQKMLKTEQVSKQRVTNVKLSNNLTINILICERVHKVTLSKCAKMRVWKSEIPVFWRVGG